MERTATLNNSFPFILKEAIAGCECLPQSGDVAFRHREKTVVLRNARLTIFAASIPDYLQPNRLPAAPAPIPKSTQVCRSV